MYDKTLLTRSVGDRLNLKGLRSRGMWAGRRWRTFLFFYFFCFNPTFIFSTFIPPLHPLLRDSFHLPGLFSGSQVRRRDAGRSSQASHHAGPPQLPAQRTQPSQTARRAQPSQGGVAAEARRHVDRVRGSSEAAAGLLLCVGPSDAWR